MTPTFWHWFALGGGLLLLEMLTPGVVFLWLALAAGIAGALLWLAPGLTWQMQVLSFAVAAVVTVGLSFRWRRRMPAAGGDPKLNRRALAYVGIEAKLVNAIGPGHGRVQIADFDLAGRRPRIAGRQPRAGRGCPRRRAARRARGGRDGSCCAALAGLALFRLS